MHSLVDQIEDAVRLLVGARHCTRMMAEVRAIVDKWESEPAVFAGDAAPLNVLVNVGLASRDLLHDILAMAMQERSTRPETKKLEYQRQLMQRRRERLRKAVMLEELRLGRHMTKDEAETAALNIEAGWISQRRSVLSSAKGLTNRERAEVLALFWHQIDTALNEELVSHRRHA